MLCQVASREAAATPRAKLSFYFDPDDQNLRTNHGGEEWLHVGVRNEGDLRAQRVRLVLKDMDPLGRNAVGQPFLLERDEEFDISPGATRLVPVLTQRPVSQPPGYHQVVLTKDSTVIRRGTPRLTLVLGLEAEQGKPESLTLELIDRNGKLSPR